MTIRNLEFLFQPGSLAVVGASNRPRTVGATVMRNLLEGGFNGPIMPVNPKYEAVAGVFAYRRVADLPMAPDMAVVCTPPATVPGLVAELAARGTRAVVVLTAGLGTGGSGDLQQAMLDAAKPHLLRILGPNCVGLVVPGIGLNASFAHTTCAPGKLAFVTQSGALATTILDWARTRGIGFSHFISLGNSADVDFGDVLDYLGSDPHTRAILLYIESVRHARKFMSAARAAARNKPVIVVKSGRGAAGARAAASHTGALAGADDVYDAAIRRAGMLRVDTIEDLFNAVETLGRARALRGEALTILTNGGGPGVMATDALTLHGGRLADLAPETVAKLDAVLPPTWSKANPVDIIGDAPPERYRQSLEILFEAPEADTILFLHAPTAIVPAKDIAEAVVARVAETSHPFLASWLGGDAVAEPRRIFAAAGIPTYETPEDAVQAFLQVLQFRANQDQLMEIPPQDPEDFAPRRDEVRAILDSVLATGRDMLTEPEAKAVLRAYDIPVVDTRVVDDAEAAVAAAREMGFPVAVKVLSHDISHKSDVGGVVLDLEDAAAVAAAVRAMAARVAALRPDARVEGYVVQPMVRRPRAHELIVGATEDPVFGPVLLFGQGGVAVEVIGDRTVALPPLNMALAGHMVSRTRIARLLAGYRDRAPVNLDDVLRTLVRVSHLVTDFAEVRELDVNPLLADADGVVALDARIRVAAADGPATARLAIRPYPRELAERVELAGRSIELRPIRPEDEPQHGALFRSLTPQDIRFRFFGLIREPVHSQLARFTQIDYDREMAFIATAPGEGGAPETLGVVRAIADPDNEFAEFAIVVRSDMKGKGLGNILMDKIIAYARAKGTRHMNAEVLSENRRMLGLARRHGFTILETEDGEVRRLELDLSTGAASP